MKQEKRLIDLEYDEAVGRLAIIQLEDQIHRANAIAPQKDIETIARAAVERKSALQSVCVDGTGMDRFSPNLRATVTNVYGMTEKEMFEAGAIPMTQEQQKALLTLERYRKSLAFYRSQVAAPALTLAETTGSRVRCAYRLIRQLALIYGDCKPGKLLVETISTYQHQLSKWELPHPYVPGQGLFRGYHAVIELLQAFNERMVTYTIHGNNCKPVYCWGLSYLPVPVPDQAFPDQSPLILAERRKNSDFPPKYSPFDDYGLVSQLFIYEQIANVLDIGKDDPQELAGLSALLNPNIARLAWPSRDELETFEETILFPWIYHQLTKYSYEHTCRQLQQEMRLTYIEAMDYLETAKHFVKYVARFNKDLERSIMLSKVDALTDKCIEDGLVTTALNAMKLKAMMTDLTRPGDDIHEDQQLALSTGLREKINAVESRETKELPESIQPPERS